MSKIQVLKPFKTILEKEHRYYIYGSGRGCGKSRNIIICLLLLATENTIRILCLREFLSSIEESVKSEMEKLIKQMGLEYFYTITKTEIIGRNGSKFLFRGIRSSNAISIKSISDINITFIEEAETISEKSWEYLIPSVMRQTEGINMVIAALNPRYDEDVIYDRFFCKEPPPKSFVCFLTQDDNPFFKKTDMYHQMEYDRKILPSSQFANKWLGKTMNFDDDCIFTKESLDLMKMPIIDEISYAKIVIGVDPAMTNEKHSNMYGIMVVGLTYGGEFHMIDNLTDHHTPYTFGNAVKKAYYDYKADSVVVETNAGGDFIKSTILFTDANINVTEVRAVNDKMKRAMPIANLASLGKIRLADRNRALLIRQMKCSTIRGYMGPQGESPDALDAFCWAVYELTNLREKQTENTVFDISKMDFDLQEYNYKGDINTFIFVENDKLAYLKFRKLETNNLQVIWEIIDCNCLNRTEFKNIDFEGIIYIPDIDFKWELPPNYNIVLYDLENIPIDELVQKILPVLNNTKIHITNCKSHFFENFSGNILANELRKYKFNNAMQQKNLIIIWVFTCFLRNFML